MATPDDRLTELAAAILDGTPVDWPSARAAAGAPDLALLDELQILELVAGGRRGAGGNEAAAPMLWGRLRLMARIGGGSFGEVYRAWDAQLEREVAVKLIRLPAEPVGDGSAILDEGRLLARVRHPGVVAVYDVQLQGRWAALCMEFVAGETLDQRVRRLGPLPVPQAVALGVQLSEALAAVHEAGVLHRDVKAANVVLRGDGEAVLTDFGAGRTIESGSDDLTGTPLYLAPEVLDGGAATPKSDIYSLGVVLHLALTGVLPTDGDSLAAIRRAHAASDRRTSWPASVPGPLRDVVDRALSSRPETRHESAKVMAMALRSSLKPTSVPRRWPMAAAVLLLLALAGWQRSGAGDEVATAPGARDPVRIAVLPFTGRAAAGDDITHDAVTRDLIAQLQTFRDARVTANTSAQKAGAGDLPWRDAGLRLGVSVVIAGDLAQTADTTVVTVHALSVPDARALWSRQYRRTAAQMLDLPRLIGEDLAGALGLRPRGEAPWAATNREAHALYIRGRAALDRFTPENVRLALQLFERAVALDPNHAAAHAAMASVFLRQRPALPNLSAAAALARAADATERALALDWRSPEAHVASAALRQARGDRAGAEREFREAVALDPSNVAAREEYAQWLSVLGRFDEALVQARAAESLDPLSPRALMATASVLRFSRRYAPAIEQARKALALDPSYPAAWLNLGHNYLGLGRFDEAIDAYQRIGRRSGNLGHALALAGRTAEARALAAELEAQHARTGLGAGDIAQIYSGLGEVDHAFAWLARMDDAQAGLTTLKVAAVWDPLRADARFAALLERYGLAD